MPQVAQGGTIRLYANYRDGTGALVDPTTPLVDILDPVGAVIVNDAVPVHDSLGSYHYDWTPSGSATIGDWTARWTGVIAGGLQEAEETIAVVASGSITPSDPQMLVSLEEYKEAIGETNSANDDVHADAIEAASAAILAYTDRDFGAPVVTATKDYAYLGGGFLNIDDCTAVTEVTLGGSVMTSTAYRAKSEGPSAAAGIYSYLELPVFDWRSGSARASLGEMGFMQNWDRLFLLSQPANFNEIAATVTADFGWPVVPKDVQRAAIWTAGEFENVTGTAGGAGDLASKSVAEVSETWFADTPQQAGSAPQEAIPANARAILDLYRRQVL